MSDAGSPIRSNLAVWKELQAREYFGTDPTTYSGEHNEIRVPDTEIVERYRPLTEDTVMAVIGCGYGRETTYFGKRVRHVYGIDVSEHVLRKTVAYTRERGVTNFTPVLAERYKQDVPEALDLVYSIVVMQHLTRDLVRDYFLHLGRKLKPGGGLVVQFFEHPPMEPGVDAGDAVEEPSVSWTIPELEELCERSGLRNAGIDSAELYPNIVWHWVHFTRPA